MNFVALKIIIYIINIGYCVPSRSHLSTTAPSTNMNFPAIFKCLLSVCLLGAAHAYTPPPGIPDPATYGPAPFGWEIDRPTPVWPAAWTASTPSATIGFYFIDNSNGAATDSGNPYGHPGLPRRTFPYMGNGALAAGTFIYIHGGNYNVGNTGKYAHSVSSIGTSAAPIWISGNPLNKPVLENQSLNVGEIAVGASYIVIENLDMRAGGGIYVRPSGTAAGVDHILIRNCSLAGTSSLSDPNGVAVGGGAQMTNYVVVYNCLINNFGKANNNPAVDGRESEQCGVYNDYNRRYTWTLNSTIYGVGADCVAGSHNANDTDRPAEYVFVGGNTLANPNPAAITSGENCIDFKCTRYVVVSQNYLRGPFGREQGGLMVIHSGSAPVPVEDCWVLFNTMHHGSVAFVSTSTNGAKNVALVGNLIYDIRSEYAVQADPWNGAAIRHMLSIGSGNHIVDNTIYDYEDGIIVQNLGPGNTCNIHGNILHNRRDPNGYELEIEAGMDYATVDYNFWPSISRVHWGNNIWTQAQLKANTPHEAHGLSGDPLFANPLSGDYTLKSDSRAINSSVEAPVYSAFQTFAGQGIKSDIRGAGKPFGTAWDMGAYEMGSGATVILRPSPPSGFKVVPK
jgi:hypothetical protein